MRKSCVQPVDAAASLCGNEQYLYPRTAVQKVAPVHKSRFIHQKSHRQTTVISTAKIAHFNLLKSDLSTLSTGLITNTIIFTFNS